LLTALEVSFNLYRPSPREQSRLYVVGKKCGISNREDEYISHMTRYFKRRHGWCIYSVSCLHHAPEIVGSPCLFAEESNDHRGLSKRSAWWCFNTEEDLRRCLWI